jgi:hypothetical protein
MGGRPAYAGVGMAPGRRGDEGHAWIEDLPGGSTRRKIPPLRGGSLALWSHRHVEVRGTPGNEAGSTADAVGGPKAANSGWAIVQNEANFWGGGLRLRIAD